MDRPHLTPLLKSLPLVAVAVLVQACGDAPTDPEAGGELTEQEALALARELGRESLSFGWSKGTPSAPSAAPSAVPSAVLGRALATKTISLTYELTRPCLLGGSVHSSGRIDVESDDATGLAVVDLTATDVHQACVFLAGDTRVAVTGDPDVTTTIHAAALGGEPQGTQSVTVQGGLLFETEDGRSGRCTVDVLVEVDAQGAGQTTRGQVCGFAFDVTVQG